VLSSKPCKHLKSLLSKLFEFGQTIECKRPPLISRFTPMAERQYENLVLHRDIPIKRSVTSSTKLNDQFMQLGIVTEGAPHFGRRFQGKEMMGNRFGGFAGRVGIFSR
jgi:hypothetical protein